MLEEFKKTSVEFLKRISDNKKKKGMLPKHEEKAYIQVREEEIRKKWVNYQEGESLQQTFTPLSLTYEMLQKLPSLEGKDVLVIANIETVLFLSTLKRDGYVNFNKLHFLTDIKKLEGKEGVSYNSFNELDKVNLGMKFDVVIGNPPYQAQHDEGGTQPKAHNLWTKFSVYAFSLLTQDGTLAFVTPSSWGSPTNKVFKLFKEDRCNFTYTNLDISRHFPGVGSTFSYWVVSNAKQVNKVNLNGVHVNKSNLKYIPANPTKEMLGIHNKVCWDNSLETLEWEWDTTSNHSTPGKKVLWKKMPDQEHIYKTYHTNAQTFYSKVTSKDHLSNKIVLTLSGNYKPTLHTSPISTSEIVMYYSQGSVSELQNTLSYLSSKLYRFITLTGKWSGYLNKQVVLGLPKLDNSRHWNDQEMYRYFNLTQEEIDLIESSVK